VPYIKYDIEDIRKDTLKPIEERLYNVKFKEEQIKVIDKYIEKPYRRFKKWKTKPNKLFLYYAYDKEPVKFFIKYKTSVIV
jgi:hypothetical protein